MAAVLLAWFSVFGWCAPPDWSRAVVLPEEGRANPYEIETQDLESVVEQGRRHALSYPVEVTGVLLPARPILKMGRVFDQLQGWLGLRPYPLLATPEIPYPHEQRPIYRMGISILNTARGEGLTISCAQCHVSELFGRAVFGLSARFPRANEAFVAALEVKRWLTPGLFQTFTGATEDEVAMYRDSRRNMRWIAAKSPAVLGLDTSLAQVALSLEKRSSVRYDEPLASRIADSKPAVWWNVKYKTRWLSDGSIVSGNPIYTNFIWNEIGRGVDLAQLSNWLSQNEEIVRDLTTAVFQTTAPPVTDFFPAELIDEARARRGERLFFRHCSSCHGVYQKRWDVGATWAERMRTVKVIYPQPTRVIDVGTDPGRHRGMTSLARLNDLEISRRNQIVIEPQRGYVPPPLVGIWARWPYFHNNSAPSLCAVLSRTASRPEWYWAHEPRDRERDFDFTCNGYPARQPTSRPEATWLQELLYDSRREGLGRQGHDEGIFLRQGREILTPGQKRDLIQFLQTL